MLGEFEDIEYQAPPVPGQPPVSLALLKFWKKNVIYFQPLKYI